MENNSYKTLYQGGTGEIVEKKSRFIATTIGIESEEEAIKFINGLKKQYWDASHNCFAYTAGKNHELQRCSDDGEPNGTAGRPMLEILLREDIHNMAVVVTRYFGGTLLGTGGLVRAYQKAVQAGILQSIIIERKQALDLMIHTDYQGLGKIQYLTAKHQIETIDSDYTDKVKIHVMAPLNQAAVFQADIIEGTNGTAVIEELQTVEYAKVEDKIIIF